MDPTTDLASIWQALRTDDSRTSGVVRRRVHPDAAMDIYVAVEKPSNRPLLLVELDTGHVDHLPVAETKGFRVGFESAGSSGPDKTLCIIELADPSAVDLFEVVVSDIVDAVVEQVTRDAALAALSVRVSRWQSFFERFGGGGLSPEHQLGLFGELWFMRRMLQQSSTEAVTAWVGPTAANQDFQLAGHAMEVKTSAANPCVELKISNLLQLDSRGLDGLAVAVLLVSRLANSPETLVEMVDSVRSEVRTRTPAKSQELEDKLFGEGYLDAHASLYASMGYSPRQASYYLCRGDFPRLTPATAPFGVGSVRYSVSLVAIAPFESDERTVMSWFGADDEPS
jgi:hypothetical protein